LQGQSGSGEEGGEADHGQGEIADRHELFEEFAGIEGGREDRFERLRGEDGDRTNRGEKRDCGASDGGEYVERVGHAPM